MFSRCMDPTAKKFRRKRGIGIMEIVVAAMVLGILYMGVSNLQKGNREALLRIRGRDGAITVAQNIIDSLGSLGLANFTRTMLAIFGGPWIPSTRDVYGWVSRAFYRTP